VKLNIDLKTSMDALCRIIELDSSGGVARWLAGAVTTVLIHAGLVAAVVHEANPGTPAGTAPVVEVSLESPPPPPPPQPMVEEAPPPVAPRASAPAAAMKDRSTVDKHASSEPAQASAVLTREDTDDDPVDDGFVTGEGERYTGGITSNLGKSLLPVQGLASGNGGTGTSVVASKPPSVDHSRAAWLVTDVTWNCGFPSEAGDSITYAAVELAVTVRPDGSPESVDVVDDPGHGFGSLAKACAFEQRFLPALDRDGRVIRGRTPPFNVGFRRR
jgi:protein TonB